MKAQIFANLDGCYQIITETKQVLVPIHFIFFIGTKYAWRIQEGNTKMCEQRQLP